MRRRDGSMNSIELIIARAFLFTRGVYPAYRAALCGRVTRRP